MSFDAVIAAQSRWRAILSAFGISAALLAGKHGPCPACGGKDRFRIIDFKDGRWICSQCQPETGDGFDLVERLHGLSFKECCAWVKENTEGMKMDKPKQEVAAGQVYAESRKLLGVSAACQKGGIVDQYLLSRAIDLKVMPQDLRFIEKLNEGDGVFSAMIAVIRHADGNGASLHKTFLDGPKKADVPVSRKVMRGPLPQGGAIRLAPVAETLGVAEGIETALSASLMRGLPVWSVINSSMLKKFKPPAEVKRLIIFGDCDPKYGGQAAAYALAHRVAVDGGIEVEVFIPDRHGDWNDVAMNELGEKMRATP